MDLLREATDEAMMARCIELSRDAIGQGEYPFGTVIAAGGQIVAEAVNRTIREGDVTRHAEVIALSIAQKALGRRALREATLYSNVEPCVMCSYCIREAWIGRVVFALGSPVMGGLSKWNILRDTCISHRIPIFAPPPEVVAGVLSAEAQRAWRDWNPLAWELAKLRGVLVPPDAQEGKVRVLPAHSWPSWQHMVTTFVRLASKAAERRPRL